ncbi:exostosin-2-like isoform X2 [Saccostrea echinata]|uniref:exostosin-2-like isoform X2 n=1 Tax=Saccostrea echinata TaxID=191078 RepID=UPI002A83CAEB|nr:exostosin-2-like isoform X2 [Saccostrea echinata]
MAVRLRMTLLLMVMTLTMGIVIFYFVFNNSSSKSQDLPHSFIRSAGRENVNLQSLVSKPTPQDSKCTYHTCVNVFHCGYNDKTRISVYVYPLVQYFDENGDQVSPILSREFYEILEAISESPYHTDNPETACLYVPTLDTLNQNNIRTKELGNLYTLLNWWNDGANHLIFNMLPGELPSYQTILEADTGKAMIAGGGFSTWSYRRGFDVSIPVINPFLPDLNLKPKSNLESRKWLLISAQVGLHSEYKEVMSEVAASEKRFLIMDRCGDDKKWDFTRRCQGSVEYKYPDILQESKFCMVLRSARLGHTALSDALMTGCIPVIVADGYVLPFSEVLDWKRAAVVIREDDLKDVVEVLKSYSMERIYQMRRQAKFFWDNYFHSVKAITMTTLQIINDRVFPYVAKRYEEWNEISNPKAVWNPMFLPLIPPSSQGFTAVVLTYNRPESLFQVIKQLSLVQSMSKIVVIWNNQAKAPPPMSAWPLVSKPLKIIQTQKNKLSNRFFPYHEIQTECILAIDDDINMLTPDEVEFGYQVWREFPDRLVGFPSRVHLYGNESNKYKYESEWKNNISMVLTGAAFHHKYYSYLYTYNMPGKIKQWVDDNMNCEDIAMNFLISNVTGKGPIKVAPRKKFKCPECINSEMLSSDTLHMVERSECVNNFVKAYQSMPLKGVEFRVDPVLYKDDVPNVVKMYTGVGSL